MNIVFVNSIRMFGGGEIWMLRTLDGLKRRGHRVSLICRPGTCLFSEAKKMGIAAEAIDMRGDFDLLAIHKCAKIFSREKTHIVLTNMDKELRIVGLAAFINKNIVVIPRRGIDYPLKNKMQYRCSYNLLADIIIANSLATKKALLKNAPWLNPQRIKVIYNGIDPAPFLGPAQKLLQQKLGIPLDHKIIGFAGQLNERKGIADLLKAFELIWQKNNAHLVLAGEGKELTTILNFAAEKKLRQNVHFLGFQDNIADFMKSIDIFVLPSLWEGFGIVLIEAMAAEKPVVTTNVSSMPEIVVDGKTGFIVPVNNPEELGKAMEKLLQQPGLAQQFGAAGRQCVFEKFTLEKMLLQLEELFRSRLEKRKRHG